MLHAHSHAADGRSSVCVFLLSAADPRVASPRARRCGAHCSNVALGGRGCAGAEARRCQCNLVGRRGAHHPFNRARALVEFCEGKSPALTACSVHQGEPTRKNSSFGACTFVCSGSAVRMTSARRPLVCRSLTIRRGCSASCATNLRAAAAQRASCASPCEPAACIGARSGCPQGRAPRLFR